MFIYNRYRRYVQDEMFFIVGMISLFRKSLADLWHNLKLYISLIYLAFGGYCCMMGQGNLYSILRLVLFSKSLSKILFYHNEYSRINP